MAFTVATRTSQETTDVTSHTVLLPDGSDVTGSRVVILVGVDDQTAVTWPTGWTGFFTGGATETSMAAAYRDIDGTEGFDGTDDSIVFTTDFSEQSNHHSYLITGHDSTTPPEAATAATGNGANADPPALSPSWGAEESLWIPVAAYRFAATFTAAPTDYTDLLALSGGDANAPLGSARRVLDAASENPGAFTVGNGGQWVSTMVAVRPAAAGAPEVSSSVSLTLDIAPVVASDHQASADIPLTLDISPVTSAQHDASSGIPLTISIAPEVRAAHQVSAQIGLTLDVAPVVDDGQPTTTPASRTFVVQAEDRTFSVLAEDRTFVVAAESRRFAVT